MLKTPAAVPPFDSSRADMRLPDAALKFRTDNRVTSPDALRRLNVTAWLYRDQQGNEAIKVNPNTTITELLSQFGPADTRDAEVGIHSEGRAAEFFRTNPSFKVLQIFTERVPCPKMCAPMLRTYFTGAPVFYYYDRTSWGGAKSASEVLAGIYGLVDPAVEALSKLQDQFERLNNAKNLAKNEHASQLNLIRRSWNPMGRAVQVFNPVSTPELSIWDDVEDSLGNIPDLLKAGNGMKAAAFLLVARMQYLVALRRFSRWKDGFDAGAHRTYIAIGVIALAAVAAAVAVFALAPAAITASEGAAAVANAEQTLVRIQLLSDQVDTFIRIAGSEGDPIQIIDEALRYAQALP